MGLQLASLEEIIMAETISLLLSQVNHRWTNGKIELEEAPWQTSFAVKNWNQKKC